MNIEIINPIEYPEWDELLLSTDQTTFFQTAAWARVLWESYRYKPLYFTIIENGSLLAFIPVMEIDSFLTGKRGVSLPFTDECPPVAQDIRHFKELLKHVYEYGKKAGWKHIEYRGNHEGFQKSPVYITHYSHTVDLDGDDARLFSTFKSNVKRNIKRAQKERIQVSLSNTWEVMKAFYRLNCMTRKQHGLPPQPVSFFKKIFEHIISQNKGFVSLAFYQQKPIAGAVYFHFGNKAIYKYGASDRRYLNLRPNNLIMWEAIKWYCQNGIKNFSFGRTEPNNQGLLQFKRAWGTLEEKLYYYKYDLEKDWFVSKEAGLKTSYNFLTHMPTFVLRLAGNLLYRHVG